MRKRLFLIALIISSFTSLLSAQTTANYTRTTSTGTSLNPMAGARQIIGPNLNTTASEVVEIGFDFWFIGVRYYSFSASTNGAIKLGLAGSGISGSSYGSGFPYANQPIIAPFFGTHQTAATGKISFLTTGTTPNRKLTVEFTDMKLNYSSGSADGTFQVVLYETTGIIQFIYGPLKIGGTGGSGANKTVFIGFSSTNANTKTMSVDHTTSFITNTNTPASSVQYNATGSVASLDNIGRQITFTPPLLAGPTGLFFSATTINSTTLNWLDFVTGEQGFVVYMSDDGGANYYFATQTAANATSTTISGLNAGTTYNFKVFSVSEGALGLGFGSPASVTTIACGAGAVNAVTYTGNGTVNWTALAWSLGHVPTPCEDAVLILNRASNNTIEAISVKLDVDVSVKSLTIKNTSPGILANDQRYFSLNGYTKVYIAGDLNISCTGGNIWSRCVFGSQIRSTINGNVILGNPLPGATEGYSSMGSNGSDVDETFILKGDLTFNKRSYITDEHTLFIFDKPGTQNITNNIPTGTGDTLQAVLFEKMQIGQVNTPTVVFNGPSLDAYFESADRGGILINTNSTLVLPGNHSINALGGKNYLTMLPGSKMLLGGDKSIVDPYTSIQFGVSGSNFPGSFTSYNFDPSSTVDYNGSNAIFQTVYNGVNYGKLVITNGSGSGRAQKITTGVVTVNATTNILPLADLTLGTTGSTNCFMSNAGNFDVANTGGLYCNANEISGAGNFSLNTGSYLGTGHPQGITAGAVATGSIKMSGTRTFTTTSNYLYNGIVNQITGTGLPVTCNDLTINNTAASGTVTIANSQLVNGNHLLQAGTFNIGINNKIKIGTAGTINSTGGFMNAKLGILEIGTTANSTIAAKWFTSTTISTLINSSGTGVTIATPTVSDTMLISSALLYGGVSGSFINTNDNLTLLSRDTATARFGNITGNSITGKVTVERYVPVLRKWRLMAMNTSSAQTAMQSLMENNLTKNGNIKAGYGTIVTDEKPTAISAGYDFDSRSISGPSLKYYDYATDKYIGIPNTQSFDLKTKGAYYNFVRGDRTCLPANALTSTTILRTTGLLKTGNVSFAVQPNKWEMIGNPYASAVDLRTITKSNLISTFYIWDTKLTGSFGLGAYQMLSFGGTDYTIMPGGGSYGAAGSIVNSIESGQGLFVKSNGAAANLTFIETAKAKGSNIFSRTAVADSTAADYIPKSTEVSYNLLSLVNGNNTTLVDGTMVAFNKDYNNEVDYEDAPKLANTSENVSIKRNTALLAIERRKTVTAADTIFLNLTGLRVAKYQWDLSMNNMDADGRTAYLLDSYTNTTTTLDIKTVNKIQFDVVNIAGAYAPGRFMIVFNQAAAPASKPFIFTGINAERNADKTATIKFYTNYEKILQDYTIEHSNDGIHFTAIASKTPENNNGGSASYIHTDIEATTADNYYRIRSSNDTGNVVYSNVTKISALYMTPAISIYPNPVTGKIINIQFKNMAEGVYNLQVINKDGRLLQSQVLNINSTNDLKAIPLGATIVAGSYQLKVKDTNGTIKMISFIIK